MSVALVGAGPGDPGLITVRGLELVRSCDVLVVDRLVAHELVLEAPGDALVIHRDDLGQDAVTRILVELGRDRDVVRLKGGDPFVFGRGGEEALALAEAGIPFEVVPGISSIAAVPAAALIPVTHRGVSDRLTVATGHADDGSEPDYPALVRTGGTIVLFMAVKRIERIASGLIRAGLPAETPAAVVSRGTLPDQEVVIAPVDAIASAASALPGPALLVIGEVVHVGASLRALAAHQLSHSAEVATSTRPGPFQSPTASSFASSTR